MVWPTLGSRTAKEQEQVPAHPGSPGKRAVKWVCVCKSNIASESQHLTMQYVTRIVVNQHSQSNKNRPNFSECNMHGQMITAYLYIQYLEYTIFVSFSALRLLVTLTSLHAPYIRKSIWPVKIE